MAFGRFGSVGAGFGRIGGGGGVAAAPPLWINGGILLFGCAFDNAVWTKSAASVTANATLAPNGAMEADKLVEDSSVGVEHCVLQNVATTTGTFSVYAKAAERTQVLLYDYTNGKGDGFNLSTGVTFIASVTTTGGAAIASVGSGWYRCSIPMIATAYPFIYLMKLGAHNYTGDGVSGAYLWGARLA